MRRERLFIQECYSLKLPFPITRLFPWLFSPPGNCFQKSHFHLANFHSSFMTHLHCSSSGKPSLTPQNHCPTWARYRGPFQLYDLFHHLLICI